MDRLILFSGKIRPLRYVTQVVIKILKVPRSNENVRKTRKEDLFDLSVLDKTFSNNWMPPVERVKTSINN